MNDSTKLLRNDGGNRRNWLGVEALLKFPTGTRLAVGARVTVVSGALRQIDDVNPVRGYLSQNDPRLRFGLGNTGYADSVEIRWPNGVVEKLEKVKANQYLRLVHPAGASRGKP